MSKVLSNLRITQHYGNNGHTGVDLGATSDRKVYANANGVVEQIQTGIPNAQGSSGLRSYGNFVLIKHPNGMKTRYAHLQSVLVKKGQSVKAGQQIGVQGNTGNSYGTHLHYEVYNSKGSRINPEPYIQNAVYVPAQTNPTSTGNITYQVEDDVKNQWLPEVVNCNSYAGNKGHAISGIRAKCEYGNMYIQSKALNGKWLKKMSSATYSKNSTKTSTYSGLPNTKIEAIKIWSDYGYVTYRVGLVDGTVCDWIDSRNVNSGKSNAYAGIFGKPIAWIQMK